MMKIGFTHLMVTMKHLLTGVIMALSLMYVNKVIVVVVGLSHLSQKLNLLTLSSMGLYTNYLNRTFLTATIDKWDAKVVMFKSL